MNLVLNPDARLRFVINGIPVATEYRIGNTKALTVRQIIGQLGLMLRCQTSGFCTVSRIIQCPSYVLFLLESTKKITMQQNDYSLSSELVDSVDATVYGKEYSPQGLLLLQFEQTTLPAIIETVARIPRLNHADNIENILFLTYKLIIKPSRETRFEYPGFQYTLKEAASPASVLLLKLLRLLALEPKSEIDRLRAREWRMGAIQTIRRWLILRYPEDVDDGVISLLKYALEHMLGVGDEEAAKELDALISRLQDGVYRKSSPASMLYFLIPRFSETMNFDLVRLRQIADCGQWKRYVERAHLLGDNTFSEERTSLVQMFVEALTTNTPQLALILSQYFAKSYIALTPRDLSDLACGATTPSVKTLIRRHNALAKIIQLSVFGLSVEQALLLANSQTPAVPSKQSEQKRFQVLTRLTYLTQLLFELGCIEGVFCVVSAVYTQVCRRTIPSAQLLLIDESFTGGGEHLNAFGKEHLQEGLRRGSQIAQCFYQDGTLLYDKYVPYYQNGKQLFAEDRKIRPDHAYSIRELEIMIKYNMAKDEPIKYFENIQAFAWKLGKPIDATQLVSMEGNYKKYRYFLSRAIFNKLAVIPYLGVLSRDLVFTCDGTPSYLDDSSRRIVNFRKLYTVYDYIVNYLAPQVNFLGYCTTSDYVHYNSNIVASGLYNGSETGLIAALSSFAAKVDEVLNDDYMWQISKLVREKAE